MILVLIEAKIINDEKFEQYLKGHLPTIGAYGGAIKSRILNPKAVLGKSEADIIVLQEWPDFLTFSKWFNSEEYLKWTQIRDQACTLRITPLVGYDGNL